MNDDAKKNITTDNPMSTSFLQNFILTQASNKYLPARRSFMLLREWSFKIKNYDNDV